MCSYILHNICEKLVGTRGGMISHRPKCDVWASRTLAFGYLVCSLEKFFFIYDEIISTSKLLFNKPLVTKYYTLFSIFFFRLWKLSFYLIQLVEYFAHILYPSNTHKLHGLWLGVLYAWMNSYSTLLHNIAPGKYIIIKVEYGLQLHFKIFLNKSDRKTTTKIIIKMLIIFGL